jgi:hypothetical protein
VLQLELLLEGCDGVVPFTVKALLGEVDLSHLLRFNQVDNHFMADQGATQGKTFYRFSRDFLCKLFAINCFELEDPGAMFDLIKVVQLCVVRCSIHPHFMDDFEPALSEAA